MRFVFMTFFQRTFRPRFPVLYRIFLRTMHVPSKFASIIISELLLDKRNNFSGTTAKQQESERRNKGGKTGKGWGLCHSIF